MNFWIIINLIKPSSINLKMNSTFRPKSDASSWTMEISKDDVDKSENEAKNSNRKRYNGQITTLEEEQSSGMQERLSPRDVYEDKFTGEKEGNEAVQSPQMQLKLHGSQQHGNKKRTTRRARDDGSTTFVESFKNSASFISPKQAHTQKTLSFPSDRERTGRSPSKKEKIYNIKTAKKKKTSTLYSNNERSQNDRENANTIISSELQVPNA